MTRIIFDSNNIGHMAAYAFGDLTYKDRYTGVMHGFLNQMLKMAEKFKTTEFIFCWDSRHYYRKWIYSEYKANRHKDRSIEELGEDRIMFDQFVQLRTDILPKLGFENIFHKNGYEADDLIAEIVARCPGENIIFSSDGDLWQLLQEGRYHYVRMFNSRTKKLFTANDFYKGWGIWPKDWALAKSMAGDMGDNVPGISGVGLIGACSYIKGQLGGVKKDKIESKEGKEITRRNLQLIALPYRAKREIQITGIGFKKLYAQDFEDVFKEYGFKRFLDKFDTWEKIFKLS